MTGLLSKAYRRAGEFNQEYGSFNRLGEEAIVTTLAVLDMYKSYSVIQAVGKGKPKSKWRDGHVEAANIINNIVEKEND